MRWLILLLVAGSAQGQFDQRAEFRAAIADEVEVRDGPREGAPVVWRLWKYMPVEIVAYRGDWRRIRDLDGHQGWVSKDDLDHTRTVMVATQEANLRRTRGGKIEWVLDRGYALRVFDARGDWLEVSDLNAVSGWIHKSVVWGGVEVPRRRY